MSNDYLDNAHHHDYLINDDVPEVSEMSDQDRVEALEEHCHSLLLHQTKNNHAECTLIVVAVLSTMFILAEFCGGVLAHSLAIMTDAGHMLSDLLSFVISIIAIRVSRSPANRRLSFGFDRAEVLGATISIIVIWIITTVLIMLAIQRILNNDLEVDVNTMMITASLGVAFNIVMGCVFRCSPHSHSHGLSSQSTNVNVRAAFVHVIGDFFQSIGVFIAAVIIKITDWRLADALCTFLFSIIVLITSITVMRDIFFVLMEATPRHVNYGELQSDLYKIQGVRTVHSLHVWSLNLDKTSLSVHLAIDEEAEPLATMKAASKLIRFKHGIHLATVQVEPYEAIMGLCDYCKPLF
uniref:Zinc transporter 2 n=1 Tax=Syphacia muris TaxID=451379 RepID=A0A0N5AZ95_9BILA